MACSQSLPTPVPTALYVAQAAWPLGLYTWGDRRRQTVIGLMGQGSSIIIQVYALHEALSVEMGFYADISWESRCKIEINVWPQFYKILLVFEVP